MYGHKTFEYEFENNWTCTHKTFEYEICILTPKSSKQNILFIGYCVLIGWFFFSMSTQIVLKRFMTVRPGA